MKATLAPTTVADAISLASMLAKSTMVPKEYQGSPGNILVAIQWGMELGLHPLQAMQSIATINGRPSIYGDALLALVKGSGLLEFIREDVNETIATCTVKRKGEEPVTRTFSMKDAEKAKLPRDKKDRIDGRDPKPGPWDFYPMRMMQMRARAFALRDVFPDVLRGINSAEESADIQTTDTTPAEEPQPPQHLQQRASGMQSLREAMGTPNVVAHELNDVLSAINGAGSIDDLLRVAEMARGLGDDDKTKARAAYAEKMAALKRESDNGPPINVTYAQVVDMLHKATDSDSLAAAADMIRHVRADQQPSLVEIYKHRLAKIEGADATTEVAKGESN